MPGISDVFSRNMGVPVLAGQYEITPVSRSLLIPYPGNHGGFVWSRPEAVIVRGLGGEEHTLRVEDRTRRAELMILGVSIIAILFGKALFTRRS